MTKGAVHPNGQNFYRGLRHDVVSRVERLLDQNSYRRRPEWLLYCQRVPPLELTNFPMMDKKIRNPYRELVGDLLKKYPDLRFVDAFVDGNDWQQGNDVYRSDHPVMQFVAKQQRLMNENPTMSKRAAFHAVEKEFKRRRGAQEREHKLLMAMMAGQERVQPLFPLAKDVLYAKRAENEATHLRHIRKHLSDMRRTEQAKNRTRQSGLGNFADLEQGSEFAHNRGRAMQVFGFELERARMSLVAKVQSTKKEEEVAVSDPMDELHPSHSLNAERRKRDQLREMSKNEGFDGDDDDDEESGPINVAERLFGKKKAAEPQIIEDLGHGPGGETIVEVEAQADDAGAQESEQNSRQVEEDGSWRSESTPRSALRSSQEIVEELASRAANATPDEKADIMIDQEAEKLRRQTEVLEKTLSERIAMFSSQISKFRKK
ncbi:unnamed protein product [Amoebophrya sp. A25]|nr:unnamed protein product [Amoebophrya sp. A25]|eukprot:GSA25T00016316001.1